MIETLLAFAFLPWFLGIVLLGCFVAASYHETISVAIIGVLVVGILAYFAYDINPFMWIYNNPITIVLGGLFYLAAGAGWSIFKWGKNLSSKILQEEMLFAKKRYNQENPGAYEYDYIKAYYFPKRALSVHNKDRIATWIFMWPISVVSYVLGEFLVDIFNKIYDLLGSVYDRMTRQYAP